MSASGHNFQPIAVVGRDSEPQLQVAENMDDVHTVKLLRTIQ